MPDNQPELEILGDVARPDPQQEAARRNRIRIRIFGVIFVLALASSLAYTFLRPPIYLSYAKILIEPPESGSMVDAGEQAAALQRQILTTGPVMGQLLEVLAANNSLAASNSNDRLTPQNLAGLLSMVSVERLEDTKVLELRAEGPDPALLPVILNTWIDIYLRVLSEQQEATADVTHTALTEQRQDLKRLVEDKRKELDWFRRQNDIVSMERDENQILARLKGLNESLNEASADEVNSRARLNAVRAAIADGKPVAREQDNPIIATLEERVTDLEEQLREQEQRFTSEYLAMDPDRKVLLRQLDLVRERLAGAGDSSQAAALAAAEQNVVSAGEASVTIREQLSDYRHLASDFTTRFAEHESLRQELGLLEERYRAVQVRVVEREVDKTALLTTVEVLERAIEPTSPTRPYYQRDAAISAGASLVLGLLVVLLFEFLNRPAKQPFGAVGIPLPYVVREPRAIREIDDGRPLLGEPARVLDDRRQRELSADEVGSMITAANGSVRILIGVLMSGVKLPEAALLCWPDFDLDQRAIAVAGTNARRIAMSSPLKALVIGLAPGGADADGPVWPDDQGKALAAGDLEALISCAAHDAGISQPEEASALVLRHSYLAWLVKHGARLGELERVGGHIPPGELSDLAGLSPPGPGFALDEMMLTHPAMKHLPLT